MPDIEDHGSAATEFRHPDVIEPFPVIGEPILLELWFDQETKEQFAKPRDIYCRSIVLRLKRLRHGSVAGQHVREELGLAGARGNHNDMGNHIDIVYGAIAKHGLATLAHAVSPIGDPPAHIRSNTV